MGFRQIIDKCTDLPSRTHLSSVFQYQQFSGGEKLAPGRSIPVEGILKCAPGFICPAPDDCGLSILATPVNSQNVVRMEMIFSNHAMARGFADDAMKRLALKIEMIARDVEALLSVEELYAQETRIPLTELPTLNGDVNGSLVEGVVNGINGTTAGANGVHEEPGEDHFVKEDISLLASMPMS